MTTTRRVAEILGVGERTVQRWTQHGILSCQKRSPAYISADDIIEFLRNPDHWHRWSAENIANADVQEYAQRVRGKWVRNAVWARQHDISESTLREWLIDGKVEGRKFGGVWYIWDD
jgi:predicted site-specific integrase-resolvase